MESIEQGVQRFIRAWEGKPSSIITQMRSYKTCLNWCKHKKFLVEIQILSAYRRRRLEKETRVLQTGQVKAVGKQLNESKYEEPTRLFQLMYETKLRIGQAIMLSKSRFKQINSTCVLVIANKVHKKSEVVPLSGSAHNIFNKAISENRVYSLPSKSTSRRTRMFNTVLENSGIILCSGYHALWKSIQHRQQVAGVSVDFARRLIRHINIRATDEYYTQCEGYDLAQVLESN